MSSFDDLFVDARAYQPPNKWEARIGNLLVLLIAGLMLLGGWMFKDWMQSQFRYLALSEGEIAIPYPPTWTPRFSEAYALQVVDPESPTAFPAREIVQTLPLPEQPFMADWPSQRAATLAEYRELERRRVTLADGRQALLLTYAYVMENDRVSEPSLVAVQAMDLVFVARYGGEKRLVVVTFAADASDWDRVRPMFQRALAKLGVTYAP